MQDAIRDNMKSRSRGGHLARFTAGWLLAVAVCAQAAGPRLSNVPVDTSTVEPTETVIRLYPVAVVSGAEITLADVAEIQGSAVRLAGGWSIAPAPASGQTRELSLGEIRAALGRRGINLSQWIFRGASRCKVTRSVPTPTNATVSIPGETNHLPNTHVQADVVAAGEQGDIRPHSMEAALRAWLAGRLRKATGTPVIRFSTNPRIAGALALTSPPYRFEIGEVGKQSLGDVALEVTVYEGSQVRQVVQILANVALRVSVVQATRPINRGETIAEGMVELRQREFERMEDIGLQSLPPVIGQRARHFINSEEMVQARHLEPMPLVERNDLVTVWVRRGPLVVKSSAQARAAGTYGSVIELRSLMSKETFLATVTGPKTVELVEGAPVSGTMAEGGRP